MECFKAASEKNRDWNGAGPDDSHRVNRLRRQLDASASNPMLIVQPYAKRFAIVTRLRWHNHPNGPGQSRQNRQRYKDALAHIWPESRLTIRDTR